MRVASLRSGRDGSLLVVSSDLQRVSPAPDGVPTLQAALDDWDRWEEVLETECERLDAGEIPGFELDLGQLAAPLPRAFQWSEGSTFLAHMERCRRARGAALPEGHGERLAAYQGGSDIFLGPRDPIPLADRGWGLDVEPTVAVITDDVPANSDADACLGHIKLVTLANDWTLREILPAEFSFGVGFYQCKPARTFCGIAVSPGALGPAWDGSRLHADLHVTINQEEIGHPNSAVDMAFDFGEILSHLSRTRGLGAGSVIGSGTVSNRDPSVGIGCLAELRAVESLAGSEQLRPYLGPGDTVGIDGVASTGDSLFGAMEQLVVTPDDVAKAS